MQELSEEYRGRWLESARSAAIVQSRPQRIGRATSETFDIVVIGGGIHGVCVAKIAAQSGLSVLLLEKGDYASGTSSRSSKMAHGGLRYLEMFDFEQVFEGIRAREALFERLPNLVRPERFLIPVPRRAPWFRFKLGVGLTLYDLLVRSKERRHKWSSGTPPVFAAGPHTLAGCYQYTDGLMSDSRLVFEFLTAAQGLGCCALNYASVSAIERQADHSVRVSWRDTRSQAAYTSHARLVVNCAGPWAPQLHPHSDAQSLQRVRYSRGSHLVFSVPWRYPSLFLPLAQKGRYYFVWPHPSGTLVGTTEREVNELELDPIPSPDEIAEILERLARDLPHAGLNRETLHYAFAGIRTLPLRSSKKGVSQLSRKHVWTLAGGVLSLLGGKYTTFAWTAIEGVKMAFDALGIHSQAPFDALDNLPSALSEGQQDTICKLLVERHRAATSAVHRAVQRLGGLVLRYEDRPEAWQEVTPGVLVLEVLHAIECEQAETIEDVVRRRLEIEATPSHGKEALEVVIAHLSKSGAGRETLAEERQEFLTRLERIDRLCS